ncbi:MAG TPA: LLM class flavin-dependent oxidoreductase, partial [Anaerolineae bacterium]
AVAVDDLSGGRLTLGVGAGWQEREHASFGFDLPPVKAHLARMREGVEVIWRLLRSREPVTYTGQYFRLLNATLLPHAAVANRPPILIGGGKAVLPTVARFADEWNVAFEKPEGFAALTRHLDGLLHEQKRDPSSVRRSLMTGLIVARDAADLEHRLAARHNTLVELRARGLVVGTVSQIVDQLGDYAGAGVQRIMLQWLNLDDMAGLEAFAKGVLPQVH